MIYNENTINSEYLDLSFKNHLATLYDNVKFRSKLSNLVADKVSIDFLNKNTKIKMNDENNKVLVRSVIDNGIIKNFVLKALKKQSILRFENISLSFEKRQILEI